MVCVHLVPVLKTLGSRPELPHVAVRHMIARCGLQYLQYLHQSVHRTRWLLSRSTVPTSVHRTRWLLSRSTVPTSVSPQNTLAIEQVYSTYISQSTEHAGYWAPNSQPAGLTGLCSLPSSHQLEEWPIQRSNGITYYCFVHHKPRSPKGSLLF